MADHSARRPPGAAGRQEGGGGRRPPLAATVGLDQATVAQLAGAARAHAFRWLAVPSIAELAAQPEVAAVAFVAAGQPAGSDGADGLAREVVLLFDPDHGGPGPAVWLAAHHRHLLFKPLHPRFLAGLFDELAAELRQGEPAPRPTEFLDRVGPLLGSSPVMVEFRQRLLRLAASDAAVLVYGEPGTERAQAARLLHRASPRRAAALVDVDGAAWDQAGHRGTSRHAERWSGRLQAAAHGTLLVSRVADLSEAAQMALCRELAVGHGTGADVRLLATTGDAPLAALADGRLCRALYWHVARFVLRVPPLRERGGDVVALAARRLAVLNRRYGTDRQLDAGARQALRDHHWPGNLEELAAVVDAAHAGARSPVGRDQIISAIDVGQAFADRETG